MKILLSKSALVLSLAGLLAFAGVALALPVPADPVAAPAACASVSPAAPQAVAPAAPLWLANGKCATCAELLKACKNFCGANNIDYHCQNHTPCAGTCTCLVPPA